MAGASLAGAAMSAKDKAKQAGLAESQQRLQQAEMIKQTNIQNQDLTLQDKQNLQDMFAQKSDNNLQSIQSQGLVRAAIGESGLKGHSMERIQRDVEGQRIRANAGLQENYQRDYSKLYIQRLSNKENTKAQLAGMAPVQMPNRTAEAVGGILGAVKTGAATYFGGQTGGMSGAISGGLNSLNAQENG
ncbi:UNVERIFIED_CONTAM: hypothetical protein RF648_18095 [Kocuria sp. CPCC 205274]